MEVEKPTSMDPWFEASEATDLAWWDGFSRLAENPKSVRSEPTPPVG